MKKDFIWFALLTAILLLIVQAVHGESPRRYVSHVSSHIASVALRLASMDQKTDSLYMLRAELDLRLCRDVLRLYRKDHSYRSELNFRLKQLDRDMEDTPPEVDPCMPLAEGESAFYTQGKLFSCSKNSGFWYKSEDGQWHSAAGVRINPTFQGPPVTP